MAEETAKTEIKQRHLEIREWVTPIVVGAYPEETVFAVVQRMQSYGIGSVIVNSTDQKPVGIFTERDVLNKVVAKGLDPKKTQVKEVMTSPIETINTSCTPFQIFKLFAEKNFRHFPVTVDDGRIIGVLSLRSRGFLQELCRIMSVLETVNELKSKFLGNVSHELRSPLALITRSAFLLLKNRNTMKEEEIVNFLEIIQNQGNRMTKLIADLLDMTALEAGKLRVEKCNIDLMALIEAAIKNAEPVAKRKGIHIHSEKTDDGAATVFADEFRIMQVLENLISNAIKFTPNQGEIIIRVQKEDGDLKGVRVAVRDTGIGIPEEKLRLIFERFEQAHDHQLGKPSGTGLGLSITKEIITLHNGQVWVESVVDEGSTFYFTLPGSPVIYS